jgi:hypothetical protein
LKVIWHDGQGACLFTKRLERGRFLWPGATNGAVTISSAQLGYPPATPVNTAAMLLCGLDGMRRSSSSPFVIS